jgi:hypothetical protein
VIAVEVFAKDASLASILDQFQLKGAVRIERAGEYVVRWGWVCGQFRQGRTV